MTTPDDRKVLEAFILSNIDSKDPALASGARLLSTGMAESLSEWADDEDSRRTPRSDQLIALIRLVGIILSIPMSWAKAGHEPEVEKILLKGLAIEINNLAKEKAKWEEDRKTRRAI